MEVCVNHPVKNATAKCKRCFKPLCDECKIVTDIGVFCSEQCQNLTKNFTERVDQIPVPKRSLFGGLVSTIKKLIILAVVLVILYFIISLTFGSTEGFFGQIRKLINVMF